LHIYYDFVDFTLYYSDYYNDFVGKNLLLCPNNMNLKKKQIDTVILKERGRDGGWGQSSS
jgi:hypothetical protein